MSEMLKSSNYRENFTDGSEKSVRIMEVIELQIFELWKAKYKSFLRKFHGDFAFDRIMEIFELRRFECRGVVYLNDIFLIWQIHL